MFFKKNAKVVLGEAMSGQEPVYLPYIFFVVQLVSDKTN